MITKELISKLFYYSDGELYWKIKNSNRASIGTIAGYQDKKGYKIVTIDNKHYKLHRLIFCLLNGYLPIEVDHIDGNSNNNKIENLRECTKSQNQHNKKIQKNNSSGIKGICWHKKSNKWLARIKLLGKYIYLGTFENLEFAELVIQEARNKYHGEFARFA